MQRLLSLLLLFCALAWAPVQAQKKTEILWDTYGVPHVYARNTEAMYYAFGWAQMHNHANLLLKLYGQARGRGAEYWGEAFRESDQQVHLFNLPELAKKKFGETDPDTRRNYEAFIRGINAYATAHPEAIEADKKLVLPVKSTDIVAHGLRVNYLVFIASEELGKAQQQLKPGSNSYAIAPSRSASGKAMLVANPHLPWSDLFTWMELHLTAPDFNAYGASLVGVPVLSIAFNEHLGWTHTVNTIDAVDLYALTLQDGGYLLDGTVRSFKTRSVPLQIRQADGSLKTETLTLQCAEHGPVIGAKNGKAFALRLANLDNIPIGNQYHKMAQARNLKEFETALRMRQNPMFNVIYADKHGDIFYYFNGFVPKRNEGDWVQWSGIVDGTSSKKIWTEYHTYDDMPRLLNPASGFIQNANDSPWTCTYPMVLKPENYPPYMAPQDVSLRPQRAINLLKDDQSITYDELVAYKLNTGMEAADRFLDDLFAAVQQHPDPLAERAVAVLQTWDKATETHSRGAVLFANWFNRLRPALFSTPWNPAQPVTTPDGLKDPKQAVALLVQAAAEVEKLYGSLDVLWGDVNRFKVGNYDVPGNGGSGDLGIFRTVYYARNKANNKNYAMHGDTYVAIVEFGDKPRAQVLLSYGNATQPGSKHVGDQLPLLSEKKLRPAWLTKAEVMQHLEEREELAR